MRKGIVYNDQDPYACEWLRRLCDEGFINQGQVIEGDIRDLAAADVVQQRFHAFAGIGLWDYALQLANWPKDIPVWTGSCPCQPFSNAGKKKGVNDERHLWPEWLRLIRECRPPVIFGEQVASPAGRSWLDTVSVDLEEMGYAIGAADLCAAGVGAPHIRQRLYFVAYRQGFGWSERGEDRGLYYKEKRELFTDSGNMAESYYPRWWQERQRGNGNTVDSGPDSISSSEIANAGATRGFWASAEWLRCRDNKKRPVEPGTFPLAYGNSGRVAVVRPGEQTTQEMHWYNQAEALKCIGNAIVPQVAAAFIEAGLEIFS